MQRARTLFALAIETPGGLKVQTIHAFAERLLQRFPLEAGVPPDFKILDDQAARELKADAIEATLTEATGAPNACTASRRDVPITTGSARARRWPRGRVLRCAGRLGALR